MAKPIRHVQSSENENRRQERAATEAENDVERAEEGRLKSMSDEKRAELAARAEAEIAMAEAELKGLEYQMNQPDVQADPAKSIEIAEAYEEKEKEIAERYAKWEKLVQ